MQGGAVVAERLGEGPNAQRQSQRDGEDDRRVTEGEPGADGDGPLALLQQLPRRVVDRRDMVGVEGVPRPEQIGGQADPKSERRCAGARMSGRNDGEERTPADDVEQRDEG